MRLFRFALLVFAAIHVSACDFKAAEDAFNEFDIVIGLEPINTVVNGVLQDGGTGALVAARLTISGQDAGAIIDAYSDPATEFNVDEGIITFGIQNELVPTTGSPVRLVATAEAQGYYTATREIQITETGDTEFTLLLTPEDVQRPSSGTAGRQVSEGNAGTSGLGEDLSLVVSTDPASGVSVSVLTPKGAVPVTQHGTPLSGALTTALRVFDGEEGAASLPAMARIGTDGTNQGVVAGLFYKLSDSSGRVAATFQSAAGKIAGACEDGGGTSIELRSSDASLLSYVQAQGGASDIQIYAYSPAAESNTLVGDALATAVDDGVVISLCLGGSATSIDLSAVGDASDGLIYTAVFAPTLGQTCDLNHTVAISAIPTSSPVTYAVAGPGVFATRTYTESSASKTASIASWTGAASGVFVPSGGTYAFSAQTAGGDVVAVAIDDPCSGSSTLTLPALTGLQQFAVSASLQCANPATEKFEVQITSESLDAVSVFYRESAGGSWTLMPRSAITSKEATDARIEVAGQLMLRPSTSYDVKGVLGANSSTQTETTPAAGGSWTIELTPDDVGLSCVSRN